MFAMSKTEQVGCLKIYKSRSKNQLQVRNFKMTNIRFHRAGESFSGIVVRFCNGNRSSIEPSPAYAPQNNGTAERLIEEHGTWARIMLMASSLPKLLWPEAVQHGNWLRNWLPSSRINGSIPIKRWDETIRIDYKSLIEFGTKCFAFITRATGHEVKSFSLDPILVVFQAWTVQLGFWRSIYCTLRK